MNEIKQRGGGDPGRITTTVDDGIMLIGIDRPAKYNGFSPKMFQELGEAYSAYEKDDAARCAVLHAEGDHFTAGLDLSLVDPQAELFPSSEVDPLSLRQPKRTKPVVAAVQGICFTIGIELMLASDITVAAADTRFSQLEVKRGLVAFGGAPIRMVQSAGWGNAMRYLLTGDEFDAETALRFGWIQEIVPPGEQKTRAIALARSIAAQAPLAVKATIDASRMAVEQGPLATVESDRARVDALIKSQDFAEGVASFKERREPAYQGK